MAALLYKGQDYRIVLDTGVDLTLASETKILYKKSNGVKGEWLSTADVEAMYYDVTSTENDKDGTWQFQAYAEIAGKTYFGEIVNKVILNNIS
jgi:hypothetical protein